MYAILNESDKNYDLLSNEVEKLRVINDGKIGVSIRRAKNPIITGAQKIEVILENVRARSYDLSQNGVVLSHCSVVYIFSFISLKPDNGDFINTKLIFCDLPGSERSRRRGFGSVNPSLHILVSLMLNRVTEPSIAAEDSRLTQILQQYLPPNSKTIIITNIIQTS